jgi:hypothetical protein
MAKAPKLASVDFEIPFPEADHRRAKQLVHVGGDRYLAFANEHVVWIDGQSIGAPLRVDEIGGGVAHMRAFAVDGDRVLLSDWERGLVIDRSGVVKHIAFAPCDNGSFIAAGVRDGYVMLVSNVRECVAFCSLDGECVKRVDVSNGGYVAAGQSVAYVMTLDAESLRIERHTATEQQTFSVEWSPVSDGLRAKPVCWGAAASDEHLIASHPGSGGGYLHLDRQRARRLPAVNGSCATVALGADGYYVCGVGLSQPLTGYSFDDEPRFSFVPLAQHAYSVHDVGAHALVLDLHGRGEAVQLIDARTGEPRFTGALKLARTDSVESVKAVPQGTLLLIRRHPSGSKHALLLKHDGSLHKLAHESALATVPWGDSFATVSHAIGPSLSVRIWSV